MNKKLLFVVNSLEFFISHRINIAIEAKKKGYEVHIAVENLNRAYENKLTKNFFIHEYFILRSSSNIYYEIKTFITLYKVIRKVKPSIIHLITLKPILYGGIISRILKIPNQVVSVTGMGYIFINKFKFKTKVLKFLLFILIKYSLGHVNQKIIFQNKYDFNEFMKLKKFDNKNIVFIHGSGVNLKLFSYTVERKNNLIVMISRLLKDKGVYELIKAEELIRKKNINARVWIIGNIDPSNPSSLTNEEIKKIKKTSKIRFFGYRKDIARIYSLSNIATLPSYREGFPKSLIEASACGRAIITTDVPGCRDAIIENETGILVKAKDPKALTKAIEKLLKDEKLRFKMGEKGRLHAEKYFDINEVVKEHLNIYNNFEIQ